MRSAGNRLSAPAVKHKQLQCRAGMKLGFILVVQLLLLVLLVLLLLLAVVVICCSSRGSSVRL